MLGLMGIDVDGTLVGTGNLVREDVWEALAAARSAGMRLSICSGRPAVGNALAYAKKLDPDGWHVFQNGASIVNTGSGQSLSESFPAEKLPALLELAKSRGYLLEVYTDTDWGITLPCKIAEQHASLLGLPYTPKEPEALSGSVVRVQWVVPHENLAEVLNFSREGLDFHPAGSPAMPDVMFISVTRAGVNKGSALRKVAEQYSLGMSKVMMVGDGENDVFALKAAGVAVAMGNGDAEAKAAAQHVVKHVDEGGLLEAIDLALKLG